MELSEFFTFFVDGYKFMPLFKNGMWDGKFRLFDIRKKLLPSGLLEKLCEFCVTRNYTVSFSDELKTKKPDRESLIAYAKSLDIRDSKGNPISPRDYQIEAFVRGVTDEKRLLISPTGSGKSLIIYMLIRWFLDYGDESKKVVIIVPTTSLVRQMKGDFGDYSRCDPEFETEKMVHEIFSGREKDNPESKVIVTTWQSAFKLNKQWFDKFGMVIGDEAHQFKAKSLNTIMSNLHYAKYRIGTTGTIDDIPCNVLTLIGNFGPVFKVTTTKSLMDSNTLAKLKITCLVCQYSDSIRKIVSKLDYKSEVDFIVDHDKRNNLIANLAADQDGNTLVLFNYVEKHGVPLYDLIKSKVTADRPVFFVSGKTPVDDRERVREITDKCTGLTTIKTKCGNTLKFPNSKKVGDTPARNIQIGTEFVSNGIRYTAKDVQVSESNAIIVASAGTFAVGINIKNIHRIIFAWPTKSMIRILQSIGRGLRLSEDGRDTILFDISDKLDWKKKQNHTLRHALLRLKVYAKESFDYKIYQLPEFDD